MKLEIKRIDVHEGTNTAYIVYSNKSICRTILLHPSLEIIVIDLDKHNNLRGIEILDAGQFPQLQNYTLK